MTANTRPSGGAGGELGKLASGGMLSLAGAFVAGGLGFLLTVVITRGLPTVAQAGAFFGALAVFNILVRLAQLGAGTGLIRFISRQRALSATGDARVLLRIATLPVLLASTVAAMLMVVASEALAEAFSSPRAAPVFATFVRAFAPFLPFAVLLNVLLGGTRGFGTMRPTVILDNLLRPSLQVALVTGALLISTNPTALAVSYWTSTALAAVLAGVWLTRRFEAEVGPVRAPAPWREFWSFALPRAASGVFAVVIQQAGVLLLGALASSTAAGVYAAATRYLVLGNAVQGAMLQAFQPLITSTIATDDHETSRSLFQTATAWSTLLTWPIYLSVGVHAQTLLLAFGPGYETGRWAMVVLAAAWLIGTALGPVDAVLVMAGRSSLSMFNLLAALVVNLIASVLLIPHLGVLGAALGWMAGILVHNILPLGQVWRAFRLQPFGRGVVAALGASTMCYGVIGLGLRWLVGGTVGATIIALAGSTVVYLGCLLRLRGLLELNTLITTMRQKVAGQGPANG